MKTSVDFYQFREAFRRFDRESNFPIDGLSTLFDYLEQLEEDIGEEIELDVVALCCDYSQMSLEDVEREYRVDVDYSDCETDEDKEITRESAVLDYLNYNTSVVGQCNGDEVIFQVF